MYILKGWDAMVMKFSRQRAAILTFLQSRKDHPTAELVYTNVKEEFPNISLGTVYRNLNQLAEAGMVAKLSFGLAATDHFDYDTSPHLHFICNRCKAVIDLPVKGDFSCIDEQANVDFDGQIQGHRLYFCGLCKDCLNKN
jgi:Fur family peroxide stress response transcriptional regulator